MKYKLLRLSLLSVFSLLLGGAALAELMSAASSEETATTVTATWDFKNPDAACANVAFQRNGGTVASDVEGIELTVDATNGKFNSADRQEQGDVQVNEGTIIKVPVVSTNDKITIVGNYVVNYTIGEEAVTELNKTYTATVADVAVGYATITATGSTYFYSITLVQDLKAAEEGGNGGGDDTPTTDITATWDYGNANVMSETMALSGSSGTVKAIEDNGILLTVEANGAAFRNNGNNIQIRNGAVFKVPVKNAGDLLVIKGYPGYSYYKINNGDEIQNSNDNPQTEYKAKASDAELGYVTITSTNNDNYYYSITVTHYAPKSENIQEKSIYKTDFSDWDDAKASETGTIVTKNTKYTEETLSFSLYRVAVMSTEDSKFASYTKLPHKTLQADKDANPANTYFTTSALANITKVRFVHAATGGNRGYKLEAKGDGDEDWVTISNSVADPAGWCEVTKTINKTNCQLRFTNLAANQNAYMFELEIFGNVDLSGAPLLGSFKANGKEYEADELFEMNSNGDYEGTIEVSKSAAMISESNQLTDIVADNGEIGTITYNTTGEGTAQTTTVTIPVTAETGSVNYLLSVVFKPDFTLTYYDVEGKEIGTQEVEKDAKIGKFDYDVANVDATKEGYKARGWFKNNYVGEKYTTEDVITDNTKLYAVETEIEGPSDSRKYTFDLTSKTFYAEDHEGFNVIGSGKAHTDRSHGWIFSTGDKIELLVGKKASIILSLCQYSADDKITASNGADVKSKVDNDGATAAIEYEGEEGKLTLTIARGSTYIHSIKVLNTTTTNYEKNGDWIIVKKGDVSSLLDAIDVANGTNGTNRVYIYVPNGTYDLGQTTLTKIGRNNISIIGESQDGVIIKNKPVAEGIGTTAIFLNSATGTYFQDLTLKNEWDYYTIGGDGRAVCIQDKGTNTICKNVTLLSYQDTYYTNNANGKYYWETSDIHGTVDFICGEGTLFMENSTLTVEKRNKDGKGECTITAPSTGASSTYGYVFNNCKIDNYAEKYNLGRAWSNAPRCAYINTTVNDNKIVAARWTAAGMNVAAKEFVEYNTVDAEGNVVSPVSNIVDFNKGDAHNKMETILNAEEAARFTLDKVFTNWKPADEAKQVDDPADAKYDNGTVTWTAVEGAIAYALFKNGEFLGITTETAYNVTVNPEEDELTIRAANSRGGFGKAAHVENTATGIDNLPTVTDMKNAPIYNLAGQRLQRLQKGINIVGGKKIIVK